MVTIIRHAGAESLRDLALDVGVKVAQPLVEEDEAVEDLLVLVSFGEVIVEAAAPSALEQLHVGNRAHLCDFSLALGFVMIHITCLYLRIYTHATIQVELRKLQEAIECTRIGDKYGIQRKVDRGNSLIFSSRLKV